MQVDREQMGNVSFAGVLQLIMNIRLKCSDRDFFFLCSHQCHAIIKSLSASQVNKKNCFGNVRLSDTFGVELVLLIALIKTEAAFSADYFPSCTVTAAPDCFGGRCTDVG